MKVKWIRSVAAWGVLLGLLLAFWGHGCRNRGLDLKLGGGPRGGTFENIAAGLAQILNEELPKWHVSASPSGGSVANLLDVDRNRLAMGLVFSGDAYLGRQGRLKEGLPATLEVYALTRLYGATAHLVVSGQGTINEVADLRGRRVAIGSAGSGSALAARRYFEKIDMWRNIIPIHIGYAIGIEDMRRGNIDAVWLQVGYPSEFLLEIAPRASLRFLSLFPAETEPAFFSDYPFYTITRIPAGTYQGQEEVILTFQDSALWIANRGLSEEFTYQALQVLFSESTLTWMRTTHPATGDLDRSKGLLGVNIPLHPGAQRFWKEQGIPLPAPL